MLFQQPLCLEKWTWASSGSTEHKKALQLQPPDTAADVAGYLPPPMDIFISHHDAALW